MATTWRARSRLRRAALVLGAVLALGGCGDDGGDGGVVVITEADSAVTLEPGQELVIELESNPTTGYSWSLTTPPDDRILSYVESTYEPFETHEDLVGSGGTERLRFRAEGAGETVIELRYVRSWEPAEPGARTLVFTVTVS
ncbi:MAG: protease inhibitor I42 family protein [Acidimicrobiia bacterium]|nr:protease inhibitor I42 family protein [Acidimicrobiia bacterium]